MNTNDAIDKRTSSSSFFGFGKNKKQDPTLPSSSSTAATTTTTTASTTVATPSLPTPPQPSQAPLSSLSIPTSAFSSSPTAATATAPKGLQVDDNFEYDDDDDEEGREILVGAFLSVVIMAGPLLAKKTNDKQHSAKTHPSYEVVMLVSY